jgi:hypothetical protein
LMSNDYCTSEGGNEIGRIFKTVDFPSFEEFTM